MRPKKCKVCGRVGEHGLYCSDACKQKEYRKRKRERMLGTLSGISSMLIDTIGEVEAQSAFDHLNQITGKKNQEQAGAAIAVIMYTVARKMADMIAESRD